MNWPQSQDFNEAVQNPRLNFSDPELQQGQPALTPLGLPQTRSGSFADVYEVRCPGTGRNWAVKCFTRQVANLRERYREISGHLKQVRLPFTVDFTYLEEGIRVRGAWYPILKMHWVEGLTLNQFVKDYLDRPQLLENLVQLWVKVARSLRDARTTHADLQHGNVLLVPGGKTSALSLKLIDYDGMFIPTLAQNPSGEVGHPAYQHPRRLSGSLYNAEVDRFPHLVICCALRCLVVAGKRLWDEYENGDNLLFGEQDLRAPGTSALFRELWNLPDAQAHALVGHLVLASQEALERTPLVNDLLGSGRVPPLDAGQERLVEAILAGRQAPGRVAAQPAPAQPVMVAGATAQGAWWSNSLLELAQDVAVPPPKPVPLPPPPLLGKLVSPSIPNGNSGKVQPVPSAVPSSPQMPSPVPVAVAVPVVELVASPSINDRNDDPPANKLLTFEEVQDQVFHLRAARVGWVAGAVFLPVAVFGLFMLVLPIGFAGLLLGIMALSSGTLACLAWIHFQEEVDQLEETRDEVMRRDGITWENVKERAAEKRIEAAWLRREAALRREEERQRQVEELAHARRRQAAERQRLAEEEEEEVRQWRMAYRKALAQKQCPFCTQPVHYQFERKDGGPDLRYNVNPLVCLRCGKSY